MEPAPHISGYAIESHPSKYRTCSVAVPKMLIDASVTRGYLFHDAAVTESFGVVLGPLPPSGKGLGEGTKLRLVKSLRSGGWALICAAALCIILPAMMAGDGGRAHAGVTLEERKLPMKFSWVACQPDCRGWVSAVGIVTADSPKDFDDFARGRARRRHHRAGFQRRLG
jgi:hypothetical protein